VIIEHNSLPFALELRLERLPHARVIALTVRNRALFADLNVIHRVYFPARDARRISATWLAAVARMVAGVKEQLAGDFDHLLILERVQGGALEVGRPQVRNHLSSEGVGAKRSIVLPSYLALFSCRRAGRNLPQMQRMVG
jgi:hypothetical protein